MQDQIINLALELTHTTKVKIADLDQIMLRTQILSMNARPERYPHVVGADVSGEEWFRRGLETHDGDQFAVCALRPMAFDGDEHAKGFQ